MPGLLFHVNAAATCPHAGQVTVMSVNTRVLVSGQPVATVADQSFVVGCPFTVPPGKPQPCVTVKWLMPAARVMVNGQPVLLQTSAALCLSPEQFPQGPPLVTATQARVIAT